MQRASLAPELHFFVCANRRRADAPLGPGCGDAGERLFLALRAEVARHGVLQSVWVTETRCLGLCPRKGAAVALYPPQQLWTKVEPTDAGALFACTLAIPKERAMTMSFDELETMLVQMEELQISKVFELARRLKPDLTMEDLRNPHDFPELNDLDWHYADGVLTGIQSVLTAVRARRKQGD